MLCRPIRSRLVTSIAIAAIVAVGCAQSVPPPTASPQVPAGPQPPAQQFVVSAAHVRNGGLTSAVVGLPATVTAHALGTRGLAALELWDGGQLVAVEEAPPGLASPAFHARWSWIPDAAGQHTLLVRAVDMAGGVVQSNAVRVEVAGSLPEPPLGSRAGPAIVLAGHGLGVGSRPVTRNVTYGITLPAVQTTLDGCTLRVSITDVADTANGVQIVGLAPSTTYFAPLAALEPDAAEGGRTVDLTGQGTFLFSATSFDSTVQVFSPPVAVTAPAECERSQWSGDVSLANGRLVTPQAVERAVPLPRPGGWCVGARPGRPRRVR